MTVQRFTGKPARSALVILTLAGVVLASPALAQSSGSGAPDRAFHAEGEGWMPPQAQAPAGLTRAEVRSDVELWIRSGMAGLVQAEPGIDHNSPEYQRRLADYSAMRADRAFASGQPGNPGSRVATRPAVQGSY